MPIYAKWNDIGNIAITGDTGSGKTNTACFFASQIALSRGRLIVCDPHGNAPAESRQQTLAWNITPLAQSFMCNVAISDEEITDAIRLANDVLASRRRGSSANYPVWLLIDEFSGVMRNHETAGMLSVLLEDIATEGRKFFVGVMIMGTQWHTTRSGGGELRSVINVAILHQQKRQIANMLLGLGKHMPDTWALQQGEAYLYRRDIIPVKIPLVTRQDMIQVAAIVSSGQTVAYGPDKQQINTAAHDQDAKNADSLDDAKHRRIVELFTAKTSFRDIACEVFQVTSGPPYQRALAAVNDALRKEFLGDKAN